MMSAPAGLRNESDAQIKLLRAVVDSATEPLWVIGNDGNVAFANVASARALGYARSDQLVGMPSHETLHHSHPDGSRYDSADCPIVWSRHRGTRRSKELFLTRSGSVIPVTWSTKPLPAVSATLLLFNVDRAGGRPVALQEQTVLSGASQQRVMPTGTALLADLQRQIDSKFQDPEFSATILANENHISIRTAQLIFAAVGASPAAEIRARRLQFARALIEAGYAIHRAAFESGFRDPGSFTRAYRRKYGMNPSQLARDAGPTPVAGRAVHP